MDPVIAHSISQAATLKSDAWELYLSDGDALDVSFEVGKLKDIRRKGSANAALRLARDGKIGFSVTTKLDESHGLVDSAVRLAPYGGAYDFSFAPTADAPFASRHDPLIRETEPERLVELGTQAREQLAALEPDAHFHANLSVGSGDVHIMTSLGHDSMQRYSFCAVSVVAEHNAEGDFLSVYHSKRSMGLLDQNAIQALVKRVAEDYRIARKPAPIKAGSSRVLFSPSSLTDILTPIAVACNGSNLERKVSRWGEARGQKLLDARLSIYDDPNHPEAWDVSPFDGEGTPTARRPIIEHGVVRNFVHSRSTAAHCGDQPTGNAQRGASGRISPGTHSFVMEAGTTPRDELLMACSGGLAVDHLLGAFTSNFLAGQVSGNISLGYRVEDGRRIGRVKNAALNVNAFDLLNSKIVGISREREWVGGSYLPWVLVEGVAISA